MARRARVLLGLSLLAQASAISLGLPRILAPLLRIRGGKDDPAVAPAEKSYPAMTEAEVMEKFNTIPVFGITDPKGNSVAVRSENRMVNWVFLSKDMATQVLAAYREQSSEGGGMAGMDDLMVSDVPLGMLWKALAKPPADAASIPGNVSSSSGGAKSAFKDSSVDGSSVEIRLMADPTDLAIAKNVSGAVDPEASPDQAIRHEAKAKALAKPWGVIPVFTMAGMKIRVPAAAAAAVPGMKAAAAKDKAAKGEASGEDKDSMVDLRPWFLSIDSCVKSFQRAAGAQAAGASGEESAKSAAKAMEQASLHLATLDELADAMMAESPVDFRSVFFMPSASSIEHLQEKASRMQAMAKGAGEPQASGKNGGGGLFDGNDDDNDEASDVFGK